MDRRLIQSFNLENLNIVDENIITLAAGQFPPNEDNVFSRVLGVSSEFRKAGLTPVFLCTDDYETILVTSRERINKNCH